MSCLRTWAPIVDCLTFHPVWLIFWRSSYLRSNCKIDHLQINLMVLPFWRKKKNQKNICFSELENLVCWWSLSALLSHDSNTAWYSCVSCMGTYGNRSLSGYGIWVWVKTIGQQNVDPCPEDRRGISHHIHMGQVSMLVFPCKCL